SRRRPRALGRLRPGGGHAGASRHPLRQPARAAAGGHPRSRPGAAADGARRQARWRLPPGRCRVRAAAVTGSDAIVLAQCSEAGRALLQRAWPVLLALMALLLLVYSEI